MRRETSLHYAAGTTMLILAGAWSCPPAAAQRYLVTELTPAPGYSYSFATGVNDSGQVVGYLLGGPQPLGFLYDHVNGLVPLDLGATLHAYPEAINNAGQVAGTVDYHAFLWDSGTVTDLGTYDNPPNDYSAGLAINATGLVAGYSDVPGPMDWHAMRWDNGAGPADLGPVTSFYSKALGINDAGTTVGWARSPGGGDVAVRWDGNGFTWLGVLPDALELSEARDINNADQVVGVSLYDSDECYSCFTAAIWADDTITDLGRFPGQFASEAHAINDAGQVVGEAEVAWQETHATLWQAGEMINLNTRIPLGSGWTLVSATGISESGTYIVGYGFVEDVWQARSFVLTVLPAVPGDANCDGVVDFADINAFVDALVSPAAYEDTYPDCRPSCDVNEDDAVDFGDINPFVDLLI